MGLFYPVLFLVNLFFVFFWILQFRYFFLFSLVAILAGFGYFLEFVRFNKERLVGNYKDALNVLSYNVRLFDQYKAVKGQEFFTRNSIFSLIKEENADVICFQEFFHGNEKYFPTIEPFMESQGTGYYFTDYIKVFQDWKHYGLATFSKYPIVNTGTIRFENSSNNSGIFTDVVFKNDTIRIFNIHLQSIGFSKADYQFVSEFIEPGIESNISGSKVIFWKLKNAFEKRSQQAEIVSRHISESPYPVIICGDFNDTPASFAYHTISRNLKDAFDESGHGLGSTYAGDMPFLRIDYILHSDKLEPYKFKKHIVNYSDHFPVSCFFKIK
jgi:endonuclease/exonuclease/phosphatase family metal-dependent hydrolase